MSGFLYYLPEQKQIGAADLMHLRLRYLLDEPGRADQADVPLTQRQVNRGPDDQGAGLVFAVGGGGASSGGVGYYPDRQRWTRVPDHLRPKGAAPLYVGFEPEAPPAPEALARAKQYDGHRVELGEPPRPWLIPVMRSQVRDEDPMPATLKLNGDGHWHREPLDRFKPLAEFADRVFDQAMRDAASVAGEEADRSAPEPMTEEEAAWGVTEALAINYRLSAFEVSLLGLIRTDRLMDADGPLLALIDWPRMVEVARELEKKGAPATPAGSSTPSG